SFALLLLGHFVGGLLEQRLQLGALFHAGWVASRWATIVLLLWLAVAVIDNVLPNTKRPWRWLTPGSILETVLLVLGTWGVDVYVHYVARYNQTYGTLGAFFVLMLWIYVGCFILLIGAEMNSVIEKTSTANSSK